MPKIIVFRQKGDLHRTRRFLRRCSELRLGEILEEYGKKGVQALREATPKDTGKTAESWKYRSKIGKDQAVIVWENEHVVDGVPIAVILQYGHGTRNGGYVEGVDYINPAMRSIFEEIAQRAWSEVKMD